MATVELENRIKRMFEGPTDPTDDCVTVPDLQEHENDKDFRSGFVVLNMSAGPFHESSNSSKLIHAIRGFLNAIFRPQQEEIRRLIQA